MKFKIKENWQIIALILIFLIAFWIRLIPKASLENCVPDMVCLQALDPFWVYRMSDSLLENNFHLMHNDPLKYYPTGWDPYTDHPLPFYTPAIMYFFVKILFNISFLEWAKIYSPLLGALFSIVIYFIGKEIYNRKTGLFAAFFIATSPSTLYRTSAGFIEKEPIAGLFMLLTIYFFIRALKKKSLLSGVIAGLCLAGMTGSWGGVQYIYYLLSAFTILILMLNKYPKSLIKAYIPTVYIGFLVPYIFSIGSYVTSSLTSLIALSSLGVGILIILRELVEKKQMISKNNLKYFVPSLTAVLIIFVLIGSTFSITLSSLVFSFQNVLQLGSTQQSVMASTVAENNPAHWGDIKVNIGTDYAARTIPTLQPILSIFNLWLFMFLGIPILAIKIIKNHKWKNYFLLFWIISAFLGSFSRQRMIFFIGTPAALVGGYFLSYAIDYVSKLDIIKKREVKEGVNIFSAFIILFISLLLITNFSTGHAFANGIGPSFNPNWQNAMNYLKTNTSEDAAILSWWDYGYWFQTGGERASIADGGNQNVTVDEIIAKRMISSNVSYFIPLLEQYGVDYVVVDYTLIGKFAAMSKIGNEGKKVDNFIQLGQPQQLQQGDQNILVYNLGGGQLFYVTIEEQGISVKIIFVTSQGEAYVKYACTENGIIPLNPPDDKPSWDGCLMFTPWKHPDNTPIVFIPTDPDISQSMFARLYIWDGKGIDFLEKVYDNVEIKIYKVNL